MRKLHERLIAREDLYAAWHSVPHISVLHFFILAGASSFISLSIFQTVIERSDLQMAAVATVSDSSSSLGQLTSEILLLSKQYNAAANTDEQGAAAEKLVEVVIARKNLLLSLAKSNPHSFLLEALPPGVTAQLPGFIWPLLERETDVDGTLTVLHVDAPPGTTDRDETRYELTTDADGGSSYHIRFDGVAPIALTTGTKAKVHGVVLDEELVVSAGAQGGKSGVSVTSQGSTVPSTGAQNTIVMMINFSNSASQPWSASSIDQLVFSGSQSSAAYYRENTFGSLEIGGDVVGWYTLPITNANCDGNYGTVADYADKAATAAGINLSSYDHKVYIYNSNSGCSWGGMGTIGGSPSRAWVFGYYSSPLVTHELGHNVGSAHAQSFACGSSQISSYINCKANEYGDVSDVMGDSYSYYPLSNSPHKVGQKWLSPTANMQTISSGGRYTLTPSEMEDSTLKVLKIIKPDTKDAYYISYRQNLGFDSKLPAAFVGGASVHLWTGSMTVATRLLDMTPGDGSFTNAALSDGRAFTDLVNGITVTQHSHSSSDVVLDVQFAGPQCVAAAPSVWMDPYSRSSWASSNVSYTAYLINNDSSACANSTFTLTPSVPAGWTGSLSSTALPLAPGTSGSVTMNVMVPAGTTDGTYALAVNASDSQNTIHASQGRASLVVYTPAPDTTLPMISITSPKNGARIKPGGNTTISASATDASGIAQITLMADGTILKTCSSASTCSLSWSNKAVASGTHTITATAIDNSSNSNTGSTSITVTK